MSDKKTQSSNSPSSQDISFDNIANKFDKNIYGTTKGRLRHEMLMHNLAFLWPVLNENACVLDAGGGTGEFTKELLAKGYQVLLNDISMDTLEIAEQKLADYDGLSLHHGAIQDIPAHSQFDLVTCHAVFEWLDNPQAVLSHLFELLKPGAYLSLSFFNQDANLFGNVLYGNFQLINNGMKQKNRLRLANHTPLKPKTVLNWLEELPCEVLKKSGIRCFHDYLKDKQQQSDNYQDIKQLELQYSDQEPYLWLGKYFHIVIRKN
ncbi:methyltransferase domain-containing protein [Planctobacterium marinum]